MEIQMVLKVNFGISQTAAVSFANVIFYNTLYSQMPQAAHMYSQMHRQKYKHKCQQSNILYDTNDLVCLIL